MKLMTTTLPLASQHYLRLHIFGLNFSGPTPGDGGGGVVTTMSTS